MSIDFTKPFTPSSFVGTEAERIHFQVPLYQRPYAWTSLEIMQLLNDLNEAYRDKSGQHYFIGMLSVAATDYDENLMDLIDGQQRITTVVLLAKVLGKKVPGVDWTAFSRERLHLVGRERDQRYLNSESEEPENPAFKAAIDTLERFMAGMGAEEKAGFSKYVFEHLAFFIAEMPAGYGLMEKNRHFVRMNNRGRQLEKHEILKVRLLSRIDETCREQYAQKWNKLSELGDTDCSTEETLEKGICLKALLSDVELQNKYSTKSDTERERLYSPILSFEDFLLIGLNRHLKRESDPSGFFDASKLLNTFQEFINSWNSEETRKFIDFLESQLEILNHYFIRRDQQGKYDLPNKQDNPCWENETEQRAHLKVLQSFLYVTRPPHEWLKKAFDWLSDFSTANPPAIDAFIAELEQLDAAKFEDMRKEMQENLEQGTSTPHYWFYRLDYEFWKRRNEFFQDEKLPADIQASDFRKAVDGFTFHRQNSVEHIQPQTDVYDGNKHIDDHFKNLALVSVSQNSKLSNHFFLGKRELLKKWLIEKQNLPSIKLLHCFTYPDWGEDSKMEHFKVILELLSLDIPGWRNNCVPPEHSENNA